MTDFLFSSNKHLKELDRLRDCLFEGPGFRVIIVECPDKRIKSKAIISVKTSIGCRFNHIELHGGLDVYPHQKLIAAAKNAAVVHVTTDSVMFQRMDWIKLHNHFHKVRETTAIFIFWLESEEIPILANTAPSVWHSRTAFFDLRP